MARLNIYLPDELAEAAREAGLNVSALTRHAVTEALALSATNAWLDELPTRGPVVDHDVALAALEEAREEFGG